MTIKANIYGGIGENARPVSLIWFIPQILLMAIIVLIIAALFAGIGAGLALALGYDLQDLNMAQASPAMLLIFMGAILGQFVGMIVAVFIKTGLEKRTLRSIGFDGFLYGARFWKNFVFGIGLAIIMLLPFALLGVDTGMETTTEMNWEHLTGMPFILTMIFLFFMLLIQAPAEEILFRGWAFSGFAARHGWFLAVLFSSLFFGLMHGDRLVVSQAYGLYYIAATTGLGLLFAAVSYRTASIIPASGLHTGYNFLLLAGAVVALTATAEDGNPVTELLELLDPANMTPPDMGQSFLLAAALQIAIPVLLAMILFQRNRQTQN